MVSDDREHVERVLAGEPQVFEHLVRKYNRLGGAIAFGVLGDFGLAEDVVQDAFLKAFRSLGSLRDPDLFRSWFSGIVRKRAIDVFRQHKSRRATDRQLEEAGEPAAEGLGPDDQFLKEEQRRKIFDAMKELSMDDRLVLVLKHMDGLSYKEISEITRTSVTAVESRLFRARRALKQKLTYRIRSADL